MPPVESGTKRSPAPDSLSLLEKLPPQNLEAEIAVLGSMLMDNDTIGLVVERLRKDDFYSTENQLIFEVLCALFDQNRSADHLILREELKKRGLLDRVGGGDYLVSLTETVPSAANAQYYADIVRQKSVQRALISTSHRILREAFEDTAVPAELLDRAERLIFEIAERQTRGEAYALSDVLKAVFAQIDASHDRKDIYTGLRTGFNELDDLTSGFQNGELIILAARPSVGKTTFALNIARNVGVELEKPVAFFSLEMSKQQIAQNMLCSQARINAHHLRRGFLQESQWSQLSLAVGRLSEAPVYIDDSPALSVLELKAKARRLKARHDVGLVVLDYLQLMEAPKMESRQQEISQVSRGLKALARELSVPVLALSQLNRAAESREDHKPRMSDLRESGSIEQDADVVLLLHREDYYNQASENKNIAEIIVAKQRNGPTGTIRLQFMPEHLRFNSLDRRQDREPL